MSQQQPIRISAATLCCIYDPETDCFLLGLNKNRMTKGYKILTALGGGIEVDEIATIRRWGYPQNKESHDLRLVVPQERIPDFRTWFYERKEREISPLRELREELVEEFDALPRLLEDDIKFELAMIEEREQLTDRTGSTGMLTHYFLEVFRVTIVNQAHWQTLQYIDSATGLYWVTRDNITNRELTIHDEIIQINAGLMIAALEQD